MNINKTSASGSYPGASGLNNASVVAHAGSFSAVVDGSTYFQFDLKPAAGCTLAVTNLAFGSRSTATGPRAFCVRSSLDNYTADLAAGMCSNNGAWALKNVPMAATSAKAGAEVTFRIYGYDGTGSGFGNWRLDDLSVAARAEGDALPAPPSFGIVAPQVVRVGQPLTFGLPITPTDGDPVTLTNVAASAGATGVWSLEAGVFRYTPSMSDLGVQTFTFTAADKDGTSEPLAVPVTVLRAQVAAVRMTSARGSYAQNFNTLATNGSANIWGNAAEPLGAWYAYANSAEVASYRTGTGSGTIGGICSFGIGGSFDRSLGALASSCTTYRYGVAFTNETEQAITNLSVRFTAEQWRLGASALTNTLTFAICVTNRVQPLSDCVWRRVPALCFDSQAVTSAFLTAGEFYWPSARSAALTRPIPAGAVALLCWIDPDDLGSDHAFGIDDLTVTWAAGAAPTAIAVGHAGVTENFDTLGPDAGADLPYLWRIESRDDAPRVSGAYEDAADHTDYANATVNYSSAGSYNFASSVPGDQAVGGLSSSSAAKSVTVFAKFSNASGMPLRRWIVRYAVEKYRNGLAGCAVRLLASTNGAAWAAAGEPTAFAGDADNGGYALDARPGTTVAVARQAAFAMPVQTGGIFYLAWQISVAEGNDTADAQALGIDDIQVFPVLSGGTMIWAQ